MQTTPEDERAAKRQKSIVGLNTSAKMPDAVVDIFPEGDVVLIMKGIHGKQKSVGLRVSSQALSLSSAILRGILAEKGDPPSFEEPKLISLEDDCEAMVLLANVLHLRNDALPSRVSPETLFKFCIVVTKYDCAVACSRCASQWFDHLYNKAVNPPVLQIIEAAYLLNDALFFARFTSRWVLEEATSNTSSVASHEVNSPRKRLLAELRNRQKEAINALKADVDILVDPCAEALSTDATHYIDVAPGDEIHPDEADEGKENVSCVVDKDAAVMYLSALRDANLWPATTWGQKTVAEIKEAIAAFHIPEYDASDACYWCVDTNNKFPTAVMSVQSMHKERLWGLCLDCYKAGGWNDKDCRFEHIKPATVTAPLTPTSTVSTYPPNGSLSC